MLFRSKALSPAPSDRYAELAAFLDDLDRALAPPPSAYLGRALVAAVLALAATAAVLVARTPWVAAPPAPPPPAAAPPAEPTEEFRRLTEIRAHEIWVSQGSPVGEAGEAVSLANWLAAEEQVRERVKQRAFEIWKSQGSPSGAVGDSLRESNMRLAEAQLLREAEQPAPAPR